MTTETKTEREAAKELVEQAAVQAGKQYFGYSRLDLDPSCIPEHQAFLDAYRIGYEARTVPADEEVREAVCNCGHILSDHFKVRDYEYGNCRDCDCDSFFEIESVSLHQEPEAVAICQHWLKTFGGDSQFSQALRTLIAAVSGDEQKEH